MITQEAIELRDLLEQQKEKIRKLKSRLQWIKINSGVDMNTIRLRRCIIEMFKRWEKEDG